MVVSLKKRHDSPGVVSVVQSYDGKFYSTVYMFKGLETIKKSLYREKNYNRTFMKSCESLTTFYLQHLFKIKTNVAEIKRNLQEVFSKICKLFLIFDFVLKYIHTYVHIYFASYSRICMALIDLNIHLIPIIFKVKLFKVKLLRQSHTIGEFVQICTY